MPAPSIETHWDRIAAQIADGDPAGQQALYDSFEGSLRVYFIQELGTDDVQDKIHDTFVAVVTAIRNGRLEEPARLPGFVRTIAQRQVTAFISSKFRNTSIELLPHGTPDPEALTMTRERRQLAARILKALPELDREILRRFYLEGQEPPQICQELQITETQFRLRKSRAKERFAELVRAAEARRSLLSRRAAAACVLALIVCAAALIVSLRSPRALPVIALETYRSETAGPGITAAEAAGGVLLRLDLRGLERYDAYVVSLVSDTGEQIWSRGVTSPAEMRFQKRGLAPGIYWVRLLGTERGRPPALLREYLLQVRDYR